MFLVDNLNVTSSPVNTDLLNISWRIILLFCLYNIYLSV